MKIVQFKPKPNPTAVGLLKDLLAQAEDGFLQEVVCGSVYADGATSTAYSSTEDAVKRIGLVTRMLHRLHVSMDDMPSEEPSK